MNWRELVTRGSLLLMETIWVYGVVAVVVALFNDGGSEPSFLAVLAVVVASFSISRTLQGLDVSVGVIRVWGVILSFLVFYAIVRYDFFGELRLWDFTWTDKLFNDTIAATEDHGAAVIAIPLLWLFWMRGVLRGQQFIGFEAVVSSFAVGLVVVIGVQVLENAADAPSTVGALAVPYVGVGLLALSLAHASRSQDQFNRSFDTSWLISVGGAILLLGAFAALFVFIDFATASDGARSGSEAAGKALGQALYYVLWPILWLTNAIMDGIAALIRVFFPQGEKPELINNEDPLLGEEAVEKDVPGWVETGLRVLVGGGITAIVLLVTAMLFTRFRKREEGVEVRESAYQEGRLGADLGDMLSGLLNRFRRGSRAGHEDLEPVRRLYFDLLDEGEKKGVSRARGETPLELAPRLRTGLSSFVPVPITQMFERARYGGLAPEAGEVSKLRGELEELRRS